jgi:hypothetical protein
MRVACQGFVVPGEQIHPGKGRYSEKRRSVTNKHPEL